MTEKYPAHKILKDNPPFSIPKRYTSFDKGDEIKPIEKPTYDSRDLISEFAHLEAENKRYREALYQILNDPYTNEFAKYVAKNVLTKES